MCDGGGDVVDGGEVCIFSAESGVVRGDDGGNGEAQDDGCGEPRERRRFESEDQERDGDRRGVREESDGEADAVVLARERC